MTDDASGDDSAFGFSGTWREYAPIAFTNLLLTIVTLGIYSFWARARTRRYLWSRTRFIDDRLEWTGTGLELFIGYLLAIVFFLVPLGVLNFILQGVIMRGHPGAAALGGLTIYLGLIYLVGVARFRALRYRLSRTFWHGIRGGSDVQGFDYGLQYLWRTIVGTLALGLLIPWSMTTLWNRRWNQMSFGPMQFEAEADWRPVFKRFLLFYLWPILLFVGAIIIGVFAAMTGAAAARPDPSAGGAFAAVILFGVLFVLVFYGILGLIALAFYAAFFREGIGKLRLGELQFGFEARTRDWVWLMLGNIGLVIVTLGIGYIFVVYRNWTFFVRHAQAYGDVRLDQLTQSTTREPGQGEGLLDAFDVGAF